jgi:hypothetical protein
MVADAAVSSPFLYDKTWTRGLDKRRDIASTPGHFNLLGILLRAAAFDKVA